MNDSESHILEQQYDGVLEITFNRPEKKNSITAPMYQRLYTLLAMADDEKAIKAVYIRGHEGCFCAGNDIADLAKGMQASSQGVGNFMHKIIHMNKPIIAGVSGVAIGIGATLLFHCDLVYADDSAIFSTPFTKLGVCPEAGSSYAIPARIGTVHANDMLLRSSSFSAQQALQMGMINTLFAKKDLHEEVKKIAIEIATLPSASVQFTKKLIRREYAEKSQQAFDAEVKGFQELLESPDAQAAFARFLGK